MTDQHIPLNVSKMLETIKTSIKDNLGGFTPLSEKQGAEVITLMSANVKEHGIPNLGEPLQLGKYRVVLTDVVMEDMNLSHQDGPITLPVSYKP